jgi:hypothetical protein
MKYIYNQCGEVIQEHDVTIHYTKDLDGLEIVDVCKLCWKKFLEKTEGDSYRKKDENERMKIKREW